MATLPFSLVLISIFTHAYWNYLVKSSENKHIFTGLSKLSEIVIFSIPAIYLLLNNDLETYFILIILIAAVFASLNYFFLSNAYMHGDLSLVYPVSRSSVLFLPVLAYFIIDEKIDMTGIAAILLILLGTLIMHLDSLNKRGVKSIIKNISNKGSVYALLAALTVAAYTIWDKKAITEMNPFLYFYLYTFAIAVFYNIFSFSTFSNNDIKKEWVRNKFKIFQVGFLNSLTYILILIALSLSKATYVGGLRQLSIVIGAFLGYYLLKEKFTIPKALGILISIIGGGLIYIAN